MVEKIDDGRRGSNSHHSSSRIENIENHQNKKGKEKITEYKLNKLGTQVINSFILVNKSV